MVGSSRLVRVDVAVDALESKQEVLDGGEILDKLVVGYELDPIDGLGRKYHHHGRDHGVDSRLYSARGALHFLIPRGVVDLHDDMGYGGGCHG